MGMARVIVPVYPGLTSAFGALIAEPKVNVVWSKHFRSDSTDAETVDEHMRAMVAAVVGDLRAEGYAGEPAVSRSISMRYWGQNYEQDVPMPAGDVTPELLGRTLEEFHRLHEQFYGYAITGEVIELIRFNVEATGQTPPPALPALPTDGHRTGNPTATRPVFFQGHGEIDCPVLLRDDLPGGYRVSGPAVIEEVVSTTLLHPGQRLDVLPTGVLSIALG
jgi:N-methylhydantoinase A